MDCETSFAIHETKNIVSAKHLVFPFAPNGATMDQQTSHALRREISLGNLFGYSIYPRSEAGLYQLCDMHRGNDFHLPPPQQCRRLFVRSRLDFASSPSDSRSPELSCLFGYRVGFEPTSQIDCQALLQKRCVQGPGTHSTHYG